MVSVNIAVTFDGGCAIHNSSREFTKVTGCTRSWTRV